MQKIIVRKKINKKSAVYILAFLIIVPVLIMRSFSYYQEKTLVSQTRKLLKQNKNGQALTNINLLFKKFNYNKKNLKLLSLYLKKKASNRQPILLHKVLKYITIIEENSYWQDAELLRQKGKIYYHLGQDYYPCSIRYLEKYLESNTENYEEDLHLLHRMYFTLKDFKKAKVYIKKLVQLNPDKIDLKISQANTYIAEGKLTQARTILEPVVFNNSYTASLNQPALLLAEIYGTLKLNSKKEFLLSYMINKSRTNVTIAKKYGMYLYQQGRKYSARRLWYHCYLKNKDDKELRYYINNYL
ncbi:MAG TPA: hypothetical protein VKS21_02625 [Spirochaetota bacterium]|nr:hypothetical protein [Spirochaetota bacterium]